MKMPYAQVYLEVDKIYNSNMNLTTENEIDELCNKVQTFIESCGWEVNDFIVEMISDRNNLNAN